MKNGYGKLTFADGGKYVGYFENNKRNGSGVYITPSGEKFEGEWSNDIFIGS